MITARPVKTAPSDSSSSPESNLKRRTVILRVGQVGKPLVVFVLAVALWQILVDTKALPSFEVASPTQTASYMGSHGSLLVSNTATTAEEVLLAFAIALVSGVVLATLINQFKVLEESILPLLVVSQVIPSIAIAPLLVLLLGFGLAPKVVVGVIISFFPILVNTLAGLKSVDADMASLSRALGTPPLRNLRLFTLPSALPYIFAGARVAVTLSVIGAVVGEFVTAKSGLGFLVLQGSSQIDPPLMFSALVVLAGMGIILFSLVRIVEYVAVPWVRIRRQ